MTDSRWGTTWKSSEQFILQRLLVVFVGPLLCVDDVFLDDDEPYIYLRAEIQKVPLNGSEPDPVPLNLTRELGTARLLRDYFNSRWKDPSALLPSQKAERMGTEQARNVVCKLTQAAEVEPRLAKGGT